MSVEVHPTMTVRAAIAATVRLIKEVRAERADRRDPQPQGGGAGDRFEAGPHQRALGNADSGGGDPKGGTHISF